MKSIEDMARDRLEAYMRPLVLAGRKIHNGWPPMVAAKKAAAASPNFAREIYKLAEKMETA